MRPTAPRASAIEWPSHRILALIRDHCGLVIYRRVTTAATKINVDNGPATRT